MSAPSLSLSDVILLCLAMLMMALAVSLPLTLFMLDAHAALLGAALLLTGVFAAVAVQLVWRIAKHSLPALPIDHGAV